LALRRNPRRAHLLVSRVLGKHLPVDPKVALEAAGQLAAHVLALTDRPPLVLGFAETATALGQAVAAGLPGSYCVLSTRRPGLESLSFTEEHSHAVGHRVLAPAAVLRQRRPVVLVDDELSSGRTAINTIRALRRHGQHTRYVVASLLDLRPRAVRAEFDRLGAELGVPVDAVSLLRGAVHVPADAAARVAQTVAEADPPQQLTPCWPARTMRADWPDQVPIIARYGWDADDEADAVAALQPVAARLAATIPAVARRVLVLGTEELMYLPMRLAEALAARRPETVVRFQSTTRSPVAAVDRDGYAVRSALAFTAPDAAADEPERVSFVYNVHPGAADHIVVVTDGGQPAPMLDALRGCAPVTEVSLRDEVAT
jgi:adenine/guanine phosphoribosyltransferase-like PRPP-binding protein